MSYKAMLIGLGGIGYKYDRYIARQDIVYTHAKALARDERFKLMCAVDVDESLRLEFSDKYDIPAFSSIEEGLSYEREFDLVVIATPTSTHFEIIDSLLNASCTKTILLEKPIADTYKASERIVTRCKNNDIPLFVNYIRRSEPSTRKVKRILDNNWANQKIKGICWYTKGWMHNASHFFNLLEYWLGECKTGNTLGTASDINGFIDVDAYVEFERGIVVFLAAWESAYSYYSIELMSPMGKISYLDGGESVFIQEVKAEHELEGYKALNKNTTEIVNTMFAYQAEVFNQIINYLNGEKYYLCTGECALKTMISMKI
jgi:predicted dehydrogenase